MKLSDIFKTKTQKVAKLNSKDLAVKIDKQQLSKLTGGVETTTTTAAGKAHYGAASAG